MYKRILVATDGSELSQKAVQSAIALAADLKAELLALKVVPYYPQSYFEGAIPIDVMAVAEVEKKWEDSAQKVVGAVVEAAGTRAVKAQGLTAKSDLVAETVIKTATDKNCDLIVMASHGRNGLKRMLLGSETQHVLTHSHIPVLVLRP